MIARIFILLMVVIVAPEIYFQWRRRHRGGSPLWRNVLIWLPCLLMAACTVYLAMGDNFIPDNPWPTYIYLLLFGLYVVPRAIVALCMAVGQGVKSRKAGRRQWSKTVGWVVSLLLIYVLVYGATVGPRRLKVKHVDIVLNSLPAAFDGYRIVHLSDIHAGSIDSSFLAAVVDTVNAQKADAVAFTGDLQNVSSAELEPFGELLASLKARDGVFSVLGNHDYCSSYRKDEPAEALQADEQKTVMRQRSYGWQLLLNEHRAIGRGPDTIYIAGTENDGIGKHSHKADAEKSVAEVPDGAFLIMLQHDPGSWQRSILPQTRAQLTLSGHTHGGQVSLFGLRATQIMGKKDQGLYEQSGRYLYVTSGVGGLLPFRFGVPPEIVVITLHSSPEKK